MNTTVKHDQELLDSRVAIFLNDNSIEAIKGPERSTDDAGTRYVSLVQGIAKAEGDPIVCFWLEPCEAMFRQFFGELSYWLGHRKSIVWRVEPELLTYKTEWVTLPKGTNVKDVSYIYCRLTAYETKAIG